MCEVRGLRENKGIWESSKESDFVWGTTKECANENQNQGKTDKKDI
jgi:hypothetical protein